MNARALIDRCADAAARAFWRDRSGAQAIEFALTAPALLTMVVGGMEFGRLIWTQSALVISTQAAARCMAVALCTTSTAPTFATTITPQLKFASSVFQAKTPWCGYEVKASYQFTFIASGLFPYTPTLTATACMP